MQNITPKNLPPEWIYIPDILYRQIDGHQRRIQLITPYYDAPGRRYPLAVFIPGSAWHRQEMYNKLPTLSTLAQRGLVVASVQVRESDIAPYPAQVEDAAAAVCYLLAHAEEYRIDPARVFLMGDSSGAHIALQTMLTAPELPLRGVVDLFGPTDILLCTADSAPSDFPNGRPTEWLLGVRDVMAHQAEAARASCAPYITDKPLPPVLILHGDADRVVSIEHSRLLYRLLTERGHRADFIEVAGAGHGGMEFWSGDALERMVEFLLNT